MVFSEEPHCKAATNRVLTERAASRDSLAKVDPRTVRTCLGRGKRSGKHPRLLRECARSVSLRLLNCSDSYGGSFRINPSAVGGEARGREAGAEARPFCANHDDGTTLALVECRSCGPLCAECDRFLHLRRAARTHQRQVMCLRYMIHNVYRNVGSSSGVTGMVLD